MVDQLGARAHPHTLLTPAPLDDAYDYNRDKQVNVQDELIARSNPSTLLTDLNLIDLTGYIAGASATRVEGEGESLVAIADQATPSRIFIATSEIIEPAAGDMRNDVVPVSVRAAGSSPATSFLQSLDLLFAKLDEAPGTETREPTASRKVTNTGDLKEFLDSMLNGIADEKELLATTDR